jgi:CHAD domain-containing protein
MASATSLPSSKKRTRASLSYWMRRVLQECDHAQRDWDADTVHDLRVALRRCRSLADGFGEVDPDPSWREMKRASRKLFQALGNLRDVQVMMEWAQKLAPAGDPVREALLKALAEKETECKREAETALQRFDRKEWRRWRRALPSRARRVPRNGRVFQHMALQRLQEAYALHLRAARNRSRIAYHQLRIGLKRYRYTIENFLPRRHEKWHADLKKLQDQLGDVHDLDVLRATLPLAGGAALTAEARARWEALIAQERAARIAEYRIKTTGTTSLWNVWRRGLPSGRRLEAAALLKLHTWARFLDPEPAHAQRVAAFAMQLFDGLAPTSTHEGFPSLRARKILQAAALLHDVGRSEKEEGHHKASYRLIRDLDPPIGWTAKEMKWMAVVARYHRGAEPRANHPGLAAFSPAEQQHIVWLAALLRFADGFDLEHNGRVTGLDVHAAPEAIVVRAHGYVHDLISAAHVAERKHLLESLCGRPVIVRSDAMALVSNTPLQQSMAS